MVSLCLIGLLVASLSQTILGASPHVVWIVIDDLGYTDLGFRGSEIPTPNLDELASTGIELTNYYVMIDCTPTRSSFMTGRLPWRFGFQQPMTMSFGVKAHLPYDQPTVAELMKKSGYNTQMIGKWHLGFASKNDTPIGRGFDNFYGYYGGAQDYYTHDVGGGYDFHDDFETDWGADGHYSDDLYFDRFFQYLEKNYAVNTDVEAQKPLFMYFAAQTIHAPILDQKPPAMDNDSVVAPCYNITDPCRESYCEKVAYFDHYVGALTDKLRSLKLWDDTFMIVTTDNGGMPDWNQTILPNIKNLTGSCGTNYPLRGGKVTLFEGGVKGLGFVNGGKNVFPEHMRGSKSSDLFMMTDWLPTIIGGVAGNEKILPDNLDGVNMIPTLFHEKKWERTTAILGANFDAIQLKETSLVQGAIIHDGWKYIHGKQLYDGYFPAKPKKAIYLNDSVTDRYLFHLDEDPNEQHNLVEEHPERAMSMAKMIIDDVTKNGWKFNYVNVQWNYSCPVNHNGSWVTWLEDEPANDGPVTQC